MSDNVRLPSLSTFPRLLMHHAQVRPNHPATREKDMGIWQTWTWSQVAEEVRAMACGLAELGFKRGDNLAIIGDNRPRLYWAMCAAQCLGGVPIHFYFRERICFPKFLDGITNFLSRNIYNFTFA